MKATSWISTPFAAACAVLSLVSSSHAQEVAWRTDYNKARQEAVEQKRPLVIDFGLPHERCLYCKMLDERTFRDPELITLLNGRFVPLKVDGGQNPTLA